MNRLLIFSALMLLSAAAAAQDLMMYARLYEGCVDDQPSKIYGASYNDYPPGMIDAEFPGGHVEFIVYIKNNTELQKVYSGEVDDQGRQLLLTGEVLVEFTVDRCGKPGNFRVVQSLSELQDAEALRVMETLPIFRAAEIDGYRVKSAYVAPIPFIKPLWVEPKPDLYYGSDYYYDDGSSSDSYYDSSSDPYYDGSSDYNYDESTDPYYNGSSDYNYDESTDPYYNGSSDYNYDESTDPYYNSQSEDGMSYTF